MEAPHAANVKKYTHTSTWVSVLVANGFADNWHQWRGPNNDGISQETPRSHPLEPNRERPLAFATPR